MVSWAEIRRTIDEDGCSRQLCGKGDDPRVPIVPAKNRIASVQMGVSRNVDHLPHSESHSGIDESPGERHLTTGYREESSQLAQAQHNSHAGGRDDEVTEEKTQRATSSEGPSGTQKETRTDDTTDAVIRNEAISMMEENLWDSRDHLGMAVLQSTLEFAVGTDCLPLDGVFD